MSARSKHVLIVGWDGVRDDERRAARTPHLDALAGRGFAATVRVHEKNPTISGPVWTTVATGVYSDRHLVRDNDLSPLDRDRYPDVLARVRAGLPGATTFAAAPWAPLVTEDAGGPLFAGGGYLPPAPGPSAGIAGIESVDAAVMSQTARELLERDHAAVFGYLEVPDIVGHVEGVTPRYRTAIETCDEHLGVLLAAIHARPHRADEDWLVVVVTDHGHRDGGGHGGDSEEERLAWIVAAGPDVDEASGAGADHADIAVHALAFLGVPLTGEDLDGDVFGSRSGA